MNTKNTDFNKDEQILREIYDLINNKECSNSKIFDCIQINPSESIKIPFNPINKYKKKAKNLLYNLSH